MDQEKIKKIAVFALILALLAISQTGAISNTWNYTFHAGNNISIVDDGLGNVTISATGGFDSNHSNLSHLDYITSGHTGFESSSHASSTYLSQTSALLLYEQKIPFQIHSHKPPFGIPYEDGGQIDYYNLKNISLLPYDILLSNYTNNYNWVNNSTVASDNSKLNKSADYVTGLHQFVNITNTLGSLGFWDYGAGKASYLFFTVNRIFNISSLLWEYQSYPNRFGMLLEPYASETTSWFRFFSLAPNSLTGIEVFRIQYAGIPSTDGLYVYKGNITVSNLSGSGTRAACIDSTGKIAASTNSTSNYLTC